MIIWLASLVVACVSGEMGFISGEKRTATVVSKTDVWAMKVNASLIERASVNCQLRFHKTFLHTLVSRLRLTTQEVSELRATQHLRSA